MQINQITDTLSQIRQFDKIIERAESEKKKLKFTQGREKREQQATIDRGQENRDKQIEKLQELGVADITQANAKLTDLQRRADAEQNKAAAAQAEIAELKERKGAILREYQGIKNSFSGQQRDELEQHQAARRSEQESKSPYMDLEEIRAENELDPRPREIQEPERPRTRTRTSELER